MCPKCKNEPKGFLCLDCQFELDLKNDGNDQQVYREQDAIDDIDSFDDKGLDE